MSREEKIKKIIKEFFEKINEKETVQDLKIEDVLVSFKINSNAPEILIGKNGQVLSDIQYLLARIINKQLGERIFIDLDINGYKKKKIEYLKELAKSVADEVALTKKEKSLAPMPAYERRIIHLELADRSDVTTESIGREPERRVIIRLRP